MMRPPAAPRYATRRTPSRPSYGAAIAKVAAALGKPLQRWQRDVVDVATEVMPDGSWAYRTVVIHVQRQAGKTTVIGPVNVHRILTRPCKTWLTAQSRQDGRDSWLDVAELVRVSPLSEVLDTRLSNGSEGLTSPLGSTFRVFAPTEDGLHGKANELVTVDEGWAFDGVDGAALEQAILPTFTTTGGQLWLPSTAGTARSAWYRGYVDAGRAAVEAGATQGIAYFEWSVSPEDAAVILQLLSDVRAAGGQAAVAADPAIAAQLDRALDLTMAAHPGEFARRDAVADSAVKMAPAEFLRAFGNHWSSVVDAVIPDHAWQATRAGVDGRPELTAPAAGAVALAFDISPDRTQGAIAGSWLQPTGQLAVDTIDARPGDDWLVARIEELAQRWRIREVAYDKTGPAIDVAETLRRRRVVEPVGLAQSDNRAACAGFLAAVTAGDLRHRGDKRLGDAVANAAVRQLGDGGWVWSRRDSAGPIAPLTAATYARWFHGHKPAAAAPVVVAARTPSPAGRTLVMGR